MIWNRKFLALLVTLHLLVLTTFCRAKDPQSASPEAQSGVIDLRKSNFNSGDIAIKGQWKFYWNSLKQPHQDIAYFEYISFPQLWQDSRWKNIEIPSQGFGSYEVTVLLPKVHQQMALKLPDTYCSYRLYINNELFAQNGEPGKTDDTTVPFWSTQVLPIYQTSDTLNLLLQVANFKHAKGGVYKDIEIGYFGNLEADSNLDQALDYFLTGCIFMGGFFFLGLYLFGRHDKAILYFALFCLSYSYRIGGSGQYSFHDIFPFLSWNFTLHCEYLSLFIAVAMFALYTKTLYPQDAPQKVLNIMVGMCFGFSVITLTSPPLLFTRLLNIFIIAIVFYLGIAIYVYLKAVWHRRIGAMYAMLSTIAICVIIISEILEYYGVTDSHREILFAGYIAFFLCQSLILSFKFATTLKKAKEEAEIGLKVKSDFLSTMSHEIRTPLNSVIGMTHLIMKETPRPDQADHLDVLLFSANNLLTIVNDVLDFSTIEQGKITFSNAPMDLSEIARNIVSGYKAAANNPEVEYILDLDQNIPRQILGDSTRTSQIIGNLVHNAIKFTNSGYVKLSIKIKQVTGNEITLKISVKDTGIGISHDKQKMIFERFTQADSSTSRVFGGTGLGLAISKRILDLQGITLHLESEPGKGSTFYFIQSFQIVTKVLREPKMVLPTIPVDEKPLSGVKILVAEDNQMNILVLQNFLKRWGAESEVARNGKEAVEMFGLLKYDIILMDLHMPVMDGYEATRKLREHDEKIPIIALTASVAIDVEEQIYSIGINDFVTKPFIPDYLLRIILHYTKLPDPQPDQI